MSCHDESVQKSIGTFASGIDEYLDKILGDDAKRMQELD